MVSFKKRQMLAIAENAKGSRGAHVANRAEKNTVSALESDGLVTVERTDKLCLNMREWWVSITPKGERALARARGET